jgi:hypothetical protein
MIEPASVVYNHVVASSFYLNFFTLVLAMQANNVHIFFHQTVGESTVKLTLHRVI